MDSTRLKQKRPAQQIWARSECRNTIKRHVNSAVAAVGQAEEAVVMAELEGWHIILALSLLCIVILSLISFLVGICIGRKKGSNRIKNKNPIQGTEKYYFSLLNVYLINCKRFSTVVARLTNADREVNSGECGTTARANQSSTNKPSSITRMINEESVRTRNVPSSQDTYNHCAIELQTAICRLESTSDTQMASSNDEKTHDENMKQLTMNNHKTVLKIPKVYDITTSEEVVSPQKIVQDTDCDHPCTTEDSCSKGCFEFIIPEIETSLSQSLMTKSL
ncbi:unnamed protein product [Thelazia callipaeda]|uniref:Uncharacterized protein n=1 Tax=Thelazia callipaeda TaxID=103827 RepID=A0A0N5CXU2_THECL|nr:unnamed protein product [Thelazia callipaeda]